MERRKVVETADFQSFYDNGNAKVADAMKARLLNAPSAPHHTGYTKILKIKINAVFT